VTSWWTARQYKLILDVFSAILYSSALKRTEIPPIGKCRATRVLTAMRPFKMQAEESFRDRPFIRYLLPLLTVSAALAIQLAASWILPKGVDVPFVVLYLAAIILAAWYGGYVPGVIASLLTMVGLPLALTRDFDLAKIAPGQVILVLILSLVISLVAQTQRRKREALGHADELDKRVRSRTAELAEAVEALKSEVAQHQRTEEKLQTQLERLNLLDQITRAIGERLDLRSVYQVVIRSLEDNLPIDFGCVCRYDPPDEEMIVTCVGVGSEALAMELAMTQQAHISINQNGLSQCVRGQLVYEQDVKELDFPFPQRLLQGGLRAMVAAPLLFESQVFGVLIAARREPGSFSSAECEFLRQLSEHVALAAKQAEVYSALQRAYDDLRQTQQTVMQQERLRVLGQMASGIAHDINNAISPVAVYTEMLLEREPNLSSRTREYLETTQRSIGDVAHTVARLREFYRQHEPELVLTPMDLNSLVQQVVDLTHARWSDMPLQRGVVIQLKTEFGSDLPAVAGIESEIREALINLIFNAVDAMPDGGTLTVRTKAVGDAKPGHVDVEVTDSGVGMEEETRRRCLEPFFTTKGERGTGLGLAMVYGVMQRHNAEIEMESAIGQGTTVRLRFPVPASAAPEIEAPVSSALPPRLRILSVDDDPLLIKSLRDALEADGHAVVSAHGGQEGIDLFRAAEERDERFAVVITDLGMPYVDGHKVASAVKNESPSTPVILLTGWGQRILADGEVLPHVDRVLNKPPKLRELRAALAELAGTNARSVQ
jgi:signal transduction histidine kinase/CheY-like chemotaxis protein